ncbi:hypothetical protein QI287_02445 [Staphylococcus saprophyticus]|nr:hypothetical protein [Staphylococcus saprophyticus]
MIILYITAYVLLLYPFIDGIVTMQEGIKHKENAETVMGIFLITITILLFLTITIYLLLNMFLFGV